MTKIGFIDCVSNAFDSFEIAEKVATEKLAGVELKRLTAPEILKIPVCAKKLLASDVDLVLAFVTAIQEDFDSLHLIVEKTIDLEIQYSKYVFYCVVSEEEFSTQEMFEKIASTRLEAVLDIAMKALHSPEEVSSQVGSGMDFSSFAAFAGGLTPEEGGTETHENKEEGAGQSGRSLF